MPFKGTSSYTVSMSSPSLEFLKDHLVCPLSKAFLEVREGQLFSESSGLSFPNIGDIPWVYKHPQSHLIQWRARAFSLINYLESEAIKTQETLKAPGLLGSTRERLSQIATAYHENSTNLKTWLSPLLQTGEDPFQIRNCIQEKLPLRLTLDAYIDNLFRDWAWETEENQNNFKTVKELLPSNFSTALVLGCGGGRLVNDLAQSLPETQFMAMDINPFLLLTAKSLHSGQCLDLHEIPRNPVFRKLYSTKHRLRSTTSPQNIHWTFADGLNPPVKKKNMDVILTPWFIDIIPENFLTFSQRINCHLKWGGTWVNSGPLGYDHLQGFTSYSLEEVCEILENQGFEIKKQSTEVQTYLDSPHGGSGRRERVFSFSAKKVSEAKEPKEFQKYPPWLLNTSLPIPYMPMMIDIQMRNKVYFEILSAIDSQRSIDEIVVIMKESYQMKTELAYEALMYFLAELVENNILEG